MQKLLLIVVLQKSGLQCLWANLSKDVEYDSLIIVID